MKPAILSNQYAGDSNRYAGNRYAAIIAAVLLLAPAVTHAFELRSADIGEGRSLPMAQTYSGFGCTGANLSPSLHWYAAPAGTQSFAITAYDPDAPTGSGWWHWIVYNIPAATTHLDAGAGQETLPATLGKQARNDFGSYDFGGACPPPGDKPHRYIFTVYALNTPTLDVPTDASAALIGFMLHGATLAKATLTTTYAR
jgi:Raf kinase inhibitor-like YbhB/YbcL family protein